MIELKDFIADSLTQIVKGITEAQSTDGGENVNAAGAGGANGGNLFSEGAYGTYTRVDFDVAVTAESNAKGKAGVRVWGIGVEGGGENKNQLVSRIIFSVPVRLPEGDQSRANRLNQQYE